MTQITLTINPTICIEKFSMSKPAVTMVLDNPSRTDVTKACKEMELIAYELMAVELKILKAFSDSGIVRAKKKLRKILEKEGIYNDGDSKEKSPKKGSKKGSKKEVKKLK